MKRYITCLGVLLLSMVFGIKLEAQQISCSVNIGDQPVGITFDGTYIWAANDTGDFVTKIVADPCTFIANIGVGQDPMDVAFDELDGHQGIYVTDLQNNALDEISPYTDEVVATIPVGSQPRGIVTDGSGNLWVANYASNSVSEIVPNTVVGTFPVGAGPYFLLVDPGALGIWVANRNSNSVMLLNADGEIVRTVTTDSQPQFITSDGGGGNIWVSCYNSQKVDKIASTTGQVLASISVSAHGGPTGLVWDINDGLIWGVTWGGYLFSINYETDALTYYNIGVAGDNLFGITLDSNGYLWITNTSGGSILQVTP